VKQVIEVKKMKEFENNTEICIDFENQRKKPGFLQVAADNLASILQSDDLDVVSESVVLDFVIAWSQVAPER
jgi:hypothetical protein